MPSRTAASNRQRSAAQHNLARRVVIRQIADALGRRLSRNLLGNINFRAEQGRHRAFTDRHGSLHRFTPQPQQPGRITEIKSADGGERRILPKRMACDIISKLIDGLPASLSSTRSVAILTAINAG